MIPPTARILIPQMRRRAWRRSRARILLTHIAAGHKPIENRPRRMILRASRATWPHDADGRRFL